MRCSTNKGAENSLPQQTSWLRDVSDENGMIYVDELQEALGVSQTTNRPDIDYLIRRKMERNDFEVVLVQDLSRLTRGGVEHGLELYFKFKALGIFIMSIVDGLIDGEEKLKKAIQRFEEARAQARANTMVQARGRIRSRKDGRLAHCLNAPFGMHRMISSANGDPLYILRNLPDGTQEQYDATGQKLIRTFEANGRHLWRHFSKQTSDRVSLIPGDSEAIAIVQQIFRRKFIDGWGPTKITRELNNAKIKPQKSDRWHVATIIRILSNSSYLGVGFCNRKTGAIFFTVGDSTPQPVGPDVVRDGDYEYRPVKDWKKVVYPHLENYLGFDADLRTKIFAWQYSHHERLANGIPARKGGDRHVASRYVLKGILRSKQGNLLMTGRTSNGRYRYYRTSKGASCPMDNDILRRLCPAQLLEDAALGALKQVVSSYSDIDSEMHSAISTVTSQRRDTYRVDRLHEERVALEKQIDFWIAEMSEVGWERIKKKTGPLKQRLLELDGLINSTTELSTTQSCGGDELVQKVQRRCRELADSLDGLSDHQKRQVLTELVERMTFDMETFEVEIDFRMPVWACDDSVQKPLEPCPLATNDVCVVDTRSLKGSHHAQSCQSIPLASFRCAHSRVKGKHCLRCTRAVTAATPGVSTRQVA
jgi:hypothetical protein